MAYMTDRKRAEGLGAAGSGTEHHWQMMVTSIALLVLVPCFVFTFGRALGMDYEAATAYYSRPFPVTVAVLTLLVGFFHFAKGAQVLIEDYVHGIGRKLGIIGAYCLSGLLAVAGVVALGIIAF